MQNEASATLVPMARYLLAWLVLFGAAACNIVPSRVPLGETFPAGVARALDGGEVRFPDAFAEDPLLVAIAYTDEADLDAERWIAESRRRGETIRSVRMHVTPGTAGILLSPFIDAGERGRTGETGPTAVLTAYGDLADRIATQTGMGKAEFARVLLVRTDGTIVWFCDTGFAPERLDDLVATIGVTTR